MSHLRRTSVCAFLLAVGLALAWPGLAHSDTDSRRVPAVEEGTEDAGGHQHGESEGHLLPRQDDVELVSKLELTDVPGSIADVTVFRDTAYLAAFRTPECDGGGVHIVDISDVRAPQKVGFVPTAPGSFVGEGVQALELRTRGFNGDVLLFNNEICDPEDAGGRVGGATLVDVSNPARPRVLAAGFGDRDPISFTEDPAVAHMVHSAFAWQQGKKAYAILVDDEEQPDVDVFDISVPSEPVKIAEHALGELFPQILQEQPANLTEVFLHDLVVKEIRGRQVLLASYWDAGYVTVDLTDPLRPRYLGDTDVTDPDPELLESTGDRQAPEGNAHQAEFTRDNRFVIGADEDFGPIRLRGRNVTDGTDILAGQGSDTPKLQDGETVEGPTVYVGLACPNSEPVPRGNGSQIAVVERGVCTFTEKVAAVEAAGGYVAVLIFDREGPDACSGAGGFVAEGDIPAFGIAPREQGFALFDVPFDEGACLAGDGSRTAPVTVGTTGDEVSFIAFFDGWGYVHLFANSTGKMAELDTYAIPEAHDRRFSERFGALSVHEVATSQRRNDLAYLSYYAGGFRVIQVRGDELVEVGSFIDQGGNDFWGVQVFQDGGREYVAASDRDLGLYIFRYTGR